VPGYQDHHSIPTLRRKVRRTLHEFLIPASVSFCYSRPPRVENPDFVFFREEQLGAVTQVTCRFNFVHESIGDVINAKWLKTKELYLVITCFKLQYYFINSDTAKGQIYLSVTGWSMCMLYRNSAAYTCLLLFTVPRVASKMYRLLLRGLQFTIKLLVIWEI